MKVMLVLDGLRAVISDLQASAAAPTEDVEVLEAGQDTSEGVEAAFVFRGTRAELLGTAKAIDALMAQLRSGHRPVEASLPYDFETHAVMATEWAS